jgi:anti-sigma-K factor RskA
MELTHRDIEELLGVYALDAVSAEEADAVDLHLRECPRCRAEVAEHREVAAALAHGGAPAPADVWSRIAGSLEEPPPQLDLGRVTSMKRRRPRSLPFRAVAAFAAAAAVVIAALGFQVSRLDGRYDDLAAALQEDGLDQAVKAALLDEGARRVALRSEDGAIFAEAVLRDNGDGFLVSDNLPPLSDDLTYQAWAVVGETAVSVGVLGNDPGAAAFKVVAPGVSALALTTEQAGGVVSSANAPVVSGMLSVN